MEESAVYPSTPENITHCPETPSRSNAVQSVPAIQSVTNDAESESNDESQGGLRGSPPPKCAICLCKCQNTCFTDSCLHQFCFPCLTKWSKVKAVCPLCKQDFKSIIHSVRSNDDYKKYYVEGAPNNVMPNYIDFIAPPAQLDQHLPTFTNYAHSRFRYRTTLTLQRSEGVALRNYLLDHSFSQSLYTELVTDNQVDRLRRRGRGTGNFRASVYRFNLWAKPLPDITGRFRECSPLTYRMNPATAVRLVPWLSRELKILVPTNPEQYNHTVNLIVDILPRYPILSRSFYLKIHHFVGNNTEHFQHEFYEFARTPFDIIGYDRDVEYVSRESILQAQHHVISSSSSESDDDSDVQISPNERDNFTIRIESDNDNDDSVVFVNEELGPSPNISIPGPSNSRNMSGLDYIMSVDIANTSSESDSDSCVIMGFLKPPEQRTPDLITLNSDSDSDVIINQDELTVPVPMPAIEITNKINNTIPKHSEEKNISYSTDSEIETVAVPKQNKPNKSRKCIKKLPLKKMRSRLDSTDTSSDSDYSSYREFRDRDSNSRLSSMNGEFSQSGGSCEGQINKHSKSKFIIQPSMSNIRKGKSLQKPNPTNITERLVKRSFDDTSCSSDSNDCGVSTKTKKLKSVVIKTNSLLSKTNPSATQSNPNSVFKEIVNDDEYSIGPSYYNNIITSVKLSDEIISEQNPCTTNICNI